nr:reverse transcriptase domain-containing protein [Tanacetum cinerariifolium]
MRTRSSSILPGESPPNPSSLNQKRRNRRCSKLPFILKKSPVDTMADQRTMAELLRAPTEGYAEAIVNDNFCNEISNFQQRFDESFHEAWDRYKYLLHACPHHGFNKLHQLDTFYNALNSADQDSLNSAAGGNLLERRTQDVLTIIENKSKVTAAAINYNQGNSNYRPSGVANQIRPPGFVQPNVQNNQNRFSQPHGYNRGNNFNQNQSYQNPTQQNQVVPLSELDKIKRMNEANMKVVQTQINNVKNELRNEMKNSIQAFMSNQTNELKNMMASFFQMNTAFTSGSRTLLRNTIANLKGKLKAITTRSGIVLDGPSVPIPPPFINPEEDERVEETLTDQDLAEYTIKEKLLELANTPLNENCSAVIHKKLPEKLRDPGKFLIPFGFSELKCKALADLGASINLMPLSVWKKLGLPELISTCMTLELANRVICTPAKIARDVFVSIGKFTFLADFVFIDYESDPRVPLILGRPFLRTARALIDGHGEEMILRDGDERLTLNMRHDTLSYSNQPQKESINMINIFNDSCEDFLEDLFATNHQRNDDLPFDIESDLKEIEYFLNHDPIKDMDSILKDSIDESNLADLNDNLIDTMLEMFTVEDALDYSPIPLYDEYDDDLFEVEFDTEYVYNDPFDSKGEKIKESKLLIDELDLPKSSDFFPSPEYDSFIFEDFFEVDALPLTNNEDKVFNLGILIQENHFEFITRVTPDKNVKKLAISHASLILGDFDPPLYEIPFLKEVLGSETLHSFSSENKEKVFKPEILGHPYLGCSLSPFLSPMNESIRRPRPMVRVGESDLGRGEVVGSDESRRRVGEMGMEVFGGKTGSG